MKSIPYRVVTSLRPPGARAPGSAPTRFLAPSTTSPGLAPHAAGTSTPTAVPLAGFLSLSAVCQHTRASRPCFVPQPSLGFSLQSVVPRLRVARPSRGRCAPLRFSVAVPEVRCSRPRPPGFTALTRPAPGSPRLPPELGRRFRRARARLPRRPGPRSPGPPRSCGFVRFEAFLPARVRAHDCRLPDDREPLLSWASAPPEPSSDLSLGPSLTRRTVPSVAELASH